jgi:nucleotide-binding universal stress UspA family protein
MKQIIVAIDFSKGSTHALRFAIGIANVVGANIQLLHVYKPDSAESIFDNVEKDAMREIQGRLDALIDKYKKLLKKGKMEGKIRKGKVYKEIVNQAKYSDAYMIVVGTHGVSGFEEFWIGSNAYRIVSAAPCPVMTIRYGFCCTKRITKIVMPIDDTRDSRQKVPFVADLAKLLCADVHIMAIYRSKMKEVQKEVEKYADQAGKFLATSDVKYSIFTKRVDNIADGIMEFADSINADLIACMTEQEYAPSNIWLGPFAQQLVNHSKIPVLSIHSKELYEVKAQL